MIWEAEKKFIGGATLAPVQNGALFKPRCPPRSVARPLNKFRSFKKIIKFNQINSTFCF